MPDIEKRDYSVPAIAAVSFLRDLLFNDNSVLHDGRMTSSLLDSLIFVSGALKMQLLDARSSKAMCHFSVIDFENVAPVELFLNEEVTAILKQLENNPWVLKILDRYDELENEHSDVPKILTPRLLQAAERLIDEFMEGTEDENPTMNINDALVKLCIEWARIIRPFVSLEPPAEAEAAE